MEAQILIRCGDNWFEFSKSRTGQIDYVGKREGETPAVDEYQKLTSSTYFSPGWYTFIQTAANNSPEIYLHPLCEITDKDTFAYLLHIGALLNAVEARDSLLAGELYLRRREIFDRFSQLTQFILEPFSVEILFTLCYGKMNDEDAENLPIIFDSAKKLLEYEPSKETLDQAFTRYFEENPVELTLPLVGTKFYCWDEEPEVLDKLTDNICVENLLGSAEKIRKAKHAFYESLEVSVQAEPYNSHDKNAIVVCIENMEAKISGNPGLQKAGHIRALAAKVLREARPAKMAYRSSLARVSHREIVVKVNI